MTFSMSVAESVAEFAKEHVEQPPSREAFEHAEEISRQLIDEGYPDAAFLLRLLVADYRDPIRECAVCGGVMHGHPDDPPVCSTECEEEFFAF